MTHDDFQTALEKTLDHIEAMLIEKNRKYGNSALQPSRIFAKSDSMEQLNVRIDDKLNRIKNQQADEDEDAELDLIGYLILKRTLINFDREYKQSLSGGTE